MDGAINSLMKNNTLMLVKIAIGVKLVGHMWLFKKKPIIKDVKDPKFKAQLVAHGFN